MLNWLSSLFARIGRLLGCGCRSRQQEEQEQVVPKRESSSFTMHGLEDRQHL
jgi:hypothetical protein